MPFVIVGLGNPTEEYAHTRHNIGRMIVTHLATQAGSAGWKSDTKLRAQRAKGEIGGQKVEFILPDTYMNRSGGAVAPLIKSAKAAERLIVIYDELDVPLGSVKVSFDRGSGGHNGVESIIRSLKTRAFVRIRVGIAPTTPSGKIKKPHGEEAVVDFLMGNLNKKEVAALPAIMERVSEITEMILTEGREKAMNLANAS